MATDYTDLARRVKEKHPEYAEVPDDELARQVIAKYPDYGKEETAAPAPASPAGLSRTRHGALRFSPDASDWNLGRLGEVESEFKARTGKPLPVRNRGQGNIHNKWGYEHHDSADISLNPNSEDGRVLEAILQEKKFPFLAFDRAIPGVATGPHHHIGYPSKKLGQSKSSPRLTRTQTQPVAPSESSGLGEPEDIIGQTEQQPSAPPPVDVLTERNREAITRPRRVTEPVYEEQSIVSESKDELPPAVEMSTGEETRPRIHAAMAEAAQTYNKNLRQAAKTHQQAVSSPGDIAIRRAMRTPEKMSADLDWHFNLSPDEWKQLGPDRQRKAILIATAAAAQDEEKKRQNPSLKLERSLEYQTKMRARLGLPAAQPQPAAPFDPNFTMVRNMLGMQPPIEVPARPAVGMGDVRMAEADDAAREKAIRDQVLQERQVAAHQGVIDPQRPTDYFRQSGIDRDVAERLTQENLARPTGREQEAAQGEIARLESANYFSRLWQQPSVESFLHKATATLARDISRVVPGDAGKRLETMADQEQSAARIADMVQSYEYSGNKGALRRIGAESTRLAFTLGPQMLAAEATGIPFPLIAAGSSYLENGDKPSKERLDKAGAAYILALAYTKGPGAVVGGASKLSPAVARLATRYPEITSRVAGGTLFGAAGGVETAARGGSAEDVLVQTVAGAIPGVALGSGKRLGEELRAIPDAAIRAKWIPEPVRTAAAKAKGYEPIIVADGEGNFAAGYVNVKDREHIHYEVVSEQKANDLAGKRRFVGVTPEDFARAFGTEASEAAPGTSANVAPMNRQIEAEAGKPPAETAQPPAPNVPSVDRRSVPRPDENSLGWAQKTAEQFGGKIETDARAGVFRVEMGSNVAEAKTPREAIEWVRQFADEMAKSAPKPKEPEIVPVDTAAHEAAPSPLNDHPEPTQPQIEAGNYKKGHVKVAGMDISIENPQGSTRSGKDSSGKEWAVDMKSHYGYIRRTEGSDAEQVDAYIRPQLNADYEGPVFVINQTDGKGQFDEHKVMLGWPDEKSAEAAYKANFTAGWDRVGSIAKFDSPAEFKQWLKDEDTTKPAVSALSLKERVKAASELGARAFAEGKKAVPAHDPELTKLLKGNEALPVLDAWAKAWHRANLAAPVPPIETGETHAVEKGKEYQETGGLGQAAEAGGGEPIGEGPATIGQSEAPTRTSGAPSKDVTGLVQFLSDPGNGPMSSRSEKALRSRFGNEVIAEAQSRGFIEGIGAKKPSENFHSLTAKGKAFHKGQETTFVANDPRQRYEAAKRKLLNGDDVDAETMKEFPTLSQFVSPDVEKTPEGTIIPGSKIPLEMLTRAELKRGMDAGGPNARHYRAVFQKRTEMMEAEVDDGSKIEERHMGLPWLRSLFGAKARYVGVTLPTESDFAEVEDRWKAAKGIKSPSALQQATKALKQFINAFRRHYIHLDPNKDAQTALSTDILRLMEASPAWAKAVAYDHLKEITGQLNDKAMDLFTRMLVLPDIIKDIEDGLYNANDPLDPGALREMPFGYTTRAEVQQDLRKFEALVDANPAIKKALADRKKITRAITKRLVDLDLLSPEVMEDDRYYHRQVMKYVNAEEGVTTGTAGGPRLTRKGFQKERVGGGDFNTRYQEAEFEWLAQAYSLIAKQETLDQLDATNNIVDDLKRQAKALNEAAMMNPMSTLRIDTLKMFRSRIGRANADLKQMAKDGDLTSVGGRFDALIHALANTPDKVRFDHPEWFPFLSHILENDLDGAVQAATIFKAVADRQKFVKKELGRNFKTWEDLVPETHTTWQPEKGNIFFFANTVEEKALGRILAGEQNLTAADLRGQMVMGGRKTQWVIPSELAVTLDELPAKIGTDPVENLWVMGQNSWKQWVLLSPARVLIYNLNNISGDMDIALAVAPKVLAEFRRSAVDLWRYQVKDKASPALRDEIQEAIKLGVVDSGLTIAEIPDINKAGAFRALVSDEESIISKGVQSYWNGVKNFTAWRENILRLAAFRYTKKAGPGFYGVSDHAQVDAIKDPNKRAAKIAREWIGDYGNISVAGQWMRRHLIPFYSWVEINAPRYARLLKQTVIDDSGAGAGAGSSGGGKRGKRWRFGVYTAKKLALLYLKAHILLGLVSLWNHLMFPDEEKELRQTNRKPHIILGRAADGSIRTLKFQGALADALEWFGLDDYPSDIRDLISGDKTWQDQAAETVKAPAERVVNSLEPFSKTTFEVATGRQLYPHFFREGASFEFATRPIRDRAEYMAQVVSLGSLYKRVTGKPVRPITRDPLWGTLEMFIVYRTDPGEASYWEVRGRLAEWQEKNGRLGSGAPDPTARTNALYYFKQASKWGDDKAADKWLKEYRDLGGSDKGLVSSIRAAHPLGSLARKDWDEFTKTLTPEERIMLGQAIQWYKQTYGEIDEKDSPLQTEIDRVMRGERGGKKVPGPKPPSVPGASKNRFGEFEVETPTPLP